MEEKTALEQLLSPGAFGILSARCCRAELAALDDRLWANLTRALMDAEIDAEIHLETITNAQRLVMSLGPSFDERQLSIVSEVMTLFQEKGMAAFPVLILNGALAFHGQVPSVEEIAQALSREAAGSSPAGQVASGAELAAKIGTLGGHHA